MKKKMVARRKGPSHADLRPVSRACKESNCLACVDPNCACHCHSADASQHLAEQMHLKKHGQVKVPPVQQEPPVLPNSQEELPLFSSKAAPQAKLRTKPLIGSKMFAGLRASHAAQRKART